MRAKRAAASPLAWIWIAVFGGVFFCLPLGAIAVSAIDLGVVGIAEAFLSPIILKTVAFTLEQALASVFCAGLVGIPLGVFTARLVPRSRARVETLLALPLLIPTVSAATAWTLIISGVGRSLGLGFSMGAVVLAHVVFNAPWMAWSVSRSLGREGTTSYDQARILGASRFQAARVAVWPRIRTVSAEAALQAFAWSAMSFAVVMALGGGPPNETLEVSLFASVRFGSIERAEAIAVAIWQMVIVGGAWWLGRQISRPRFRYRAGAREGANPPASHELRRQDGIASRPYFSAVFLAALIFLLPYAFAALAAGGSGDHAGFSDLPVASWLAHSLFLGFAAAMFALVTTFALIRARAGLLAQLPAGVSPLTLGFGLWLVPGLDFVGGHVAVSALICAGVLGLLFTPFAYRILFPVYARIRTSERWVAQSLGATPAQSFWRMEIYTWMKPVTSAFALVFGAAVGEVSIVLFFSHPDFVTLPVAASRLLGQYRFAAAQSISLGVLLMGAGAFLFSERLGRSHA